MPVVNRNDLTLTLHNVNCSDELLKSTVPESQLMKQEHGKELIRELIRIGKPTQLTKDVKGLDSYLRLREICKGIDREDLPCNNLPDLSQETESDLWTNSEAVFILIAVTCCYGPLLLFIPGWYEGYVQGQNVDWWMDRMLIDVARYGAAWWIANKVEGWVCLNVRKLKFKTT